MKRRKAPRKISKNEKVLILILLTLLALFAVSFIYASATGQGIKNVLRKISGTTTQCNDKIDNDGDGLIDYKGLYEGKGRNKILVASPDTDCTDPADNSELFEASSCAPSLEICDNKDNDCDGLVDEDVKNTYYQDSDADGYGSSFISLQECSQPNGYVLNNQDCRDDNSNINPGAIETCNFVDDDCDGLIDENSVCSPNQEFSSWRYDFDGSSLDLNFWVISNWQAPGYIVNSHKGVFQPDRISINNGYLILALTQEVGVVDSNTNSVISRGSEVYTISKHGYGTYEWRMRTSSTATSPTTTGTPVSGSVSAGFNYVNNSQTEIDFEIEGSHPSNLHMVNWLNPDPSKAPTWPDDRTASSAIISGMHDDFKTYKYVWTPDYIEYYVDDVLKVKHTTHVPIVPAHFFMNHWGTNNPNWGGYATIGTTRYVYIDWVRYTPLGQDPVQ